MASATSPSAPGHRRGPGVHSLYFSIPVVILAAFFLLRLATNPRWNSDAAIAVMSASALAVGIIVISRTSGMTTDVDNYMFGSVLAMTWADVALSGGTVPCGAGPVRAVLPQALRRDVR